MISKETLARLKEILLETIKPEKEHPIRDAIEESYSLPELVAKLDWYYGDNENLILNSLNIILNKYYYTKVLVNGSGVIGPIKSW